MWKSFFIVIMLFLFIVIFASSAVSNINLTNTPLPPNSGAAGAGPAGSANRTTLLGGAAQPGLVGQQGGCGGSYTVRSGDTLSSIAKGCGVALQDLIAANPGLANPNLIHPGQVLVMAAPPPAAAAQPAVVQAAPSPTAVLPVAATATQAPPAAAPVQQNTRSALPATPTFAPSVPPGGTYHVYLGGFAPGAAVSVLLGPLGFAPSEVGRGQADAQGVYNGSVTLPTSALPGTQWRVTVQTVAEPVVKVSSPVFIIQE